MQNKYGVEIETIMQGSVAETEGLLPGDVLLSINGHRLNDGIDFMFYSNDKDLHIFQDKLLASEPKC